jgi:hypothetical protein
MDELPQKDDSIVPRKDHVDEKDKGDPSEVTSIPLTPDDVENTTSTSAQAYRLYKRRWFGVFAMASTLSFVNWPHLNSADENSSFWRLSAPPAGLGLVRYPTMVRPRNLDSLYTR